MFYVSSGFDWAIGEYISNVNFSESPHKNFFLQYVPDDWKTNQDYLARRSAELELERLRSLMFPNVPSRRDAIFLCKTLNHAEGWRARGSRSNYNIYSLMETEIENSWEANVVWYNYLVRLYKGEIRNIFSDNRENEIEECLKCYWNNTKSEPYSCSSEPEILYIGKLRICDKFT